MTFDSFIKIRAGKTCTHPRGIPGQCVCLYRCYLDDVLKVPQGPSVKGAKDLWTSKLPHFIKIPNSLTAVPQKGDIMVWGAFPGNPFGHVGMVVDANLWRFRSFDSNWSTPLKAKIETHSYTRPRVIGWLRKK